MSEPLFSKGHEFRNPDKPEEGYRITQDVFWGEHVRAVQFEAFGGAILPRENEALPHWLASKIFNNIR